MQTLTMDQIYRKPEAAMAVALRRFYGEFPAIDGVALDTIRDFAHDRFTAATTLARVMDPRFDTDAPEYAYRLQVEESLTLAHALEGGR